MNAMQYKIKLPNDYDMNKIRERVAQNGMKTDGFEGLGIKAYLIKDTSTKKEYAPFYIWKQQAGMSHFIFDGFYDNILSTFGWQQINIAIPYSVELKPTIQNAKYVLEVEQEINETTHMAGLNFSVENVSYEARVLVYNPDKWKKVEFYFFEDIPQNLEETASIYEILHVSQ